MSPYPSGSPAVIVDPFSSGGLYAPAFRAAEVPVMAVVSYPEIPPAYAGSFRPEDFDEVLTWTGKEDALVERLRELRPRCVLPGAEIGVELADRLAAQVVPEVANVPALAAARRHKYAMAQAVAAAGLPVLRQLCCDDADEVAAWLEREGLTGHDLVVKPPKSASTDGVTRIVGGRGWRQEFEAQLGRLNQWQIPNDQMLVQEYATGTEYVVDVFSHSGTHTVTDVCRYRKIDSGGQMAVYESMDWVPEDRPEVPELVRYTRGVLDAVGFRWGAAHVEVMMTADGPRLIEVNARPHGGGHPRFCRTATGDSQVDRAVAYFTGRGPVPSGYELHRRVRVVFLISRSSGIVRNAEVLHDIKEVTSHHVSAVPVRNGDRIAPTKDLLGTLSLGFVVLAHEDPAQLDADHAAIRRIESLLTVDPEADAA
ncbi:ATP-grasp domain-containing protein [Streptomyces halobius]|uniref:ATP-grasp domain-containing protein n=1 Tax=Streptomyces halobius TaxID=2879846 RepID=A0ABY4MHI8_9ACTN|nr:ATP-grasp domain-containing protein [Streptomyces halobius]UQA97266.1 ATP-grasp domain-containing protein [Streptomyces halobius]